MTTQQPLLSLHYRLFHAKCTVEVVMHYVHTIDNSCHESQHLIQHVIPHENLISYNKKALHLVSLHVLRLMIAIGW